MKGRLDISAYPYAWLDEMVENTLNPQSPDYKVPDGKALPEIEFRFAEELRQAISSLKCQAFILLSGETKKAVVRQYTEALTLLLEQARQNLAAYPPGKTIANTGENLLILLEAAEAQINRRYAKYLVKTEYAATVEIPTDNALFKVLCRLSVDQIAILLKAADDIKLLVSRSLSLVFRSIMPYLSTERLKNISWKSARSSTYKFEESDKTAAIQTLEKLIDKIREY